MPITSQVCNTQACGTASSNIVVYDDALNAQWSSTWSWSVNINAAWTSSPAPYSGTNCIQLSMPAPGWGGMSLHASSTFTATGVSFWLNPGSATGLQLKVGLTHSGSAIQPEAALTSNFPANTWTLVNLPITALDASGTNAPYDGLVIQSATSNAQTVYLDQIVILTSGSVAPGGGSSTGSGHPGSSTGSGPTDIPKWIPSAWGSCNVLCGGGQQQRNLTCLYASGAAAPPSLCGTKPATHQSCNTQPCATVSPLVVYHDTALAPGWSGDWSFNVGINYNAASAPTPYSGTSCIELTMAAQSWGGMTLHYDSTFSANTYGGISFWVNPGSNANLLLQATLSHNGVAVQPQTPLHVLGYTFAPNTWTQVVIPLKKLDPNCASTLLYDGIIIQSYTSLGQTAFIDDILIYPIGAVPDSTSPGTYVAIGVGTFCGIGMVAAGAFYCRRRRMSKPLLPVRASPSSANLMASPSFASAYPSSPGNHGLYVATQTESPAHPIADVTVGILPPLHTSSSADALASIGAAARGQHPGSPLGSPLSPPVQPRARPPPPPPRAAPGIPPRAPPTTPCSQPISGSLRRPMSPAPRQF